MIGNYLPLLIYLIAILWEVIFFPNCSLTSGDAKPRRLYVDESSLNVNGHSIDFVIPPLHNRMIPNKTSEIPISSKIKNILRNPNFQFVVNPKYNAESRETVSLVVLFPAECAENIVQIFGPYLNELSAILERAPWITKKVVVSFFSLTSQIQSDIKRYKLTAFREVYIFNLAGWAGQCKNSLHEFKWSHMQINHIGWNGNYPNMDLISISAKLVAQYNLVDTSSQSRSRESTSYDNKLLDDYISNAKWLGLSSLDLLRGPNGMHAEYLFSNIDSVSYTMQFIDINTAKPPRSSYLLEDLGKVMLKLLQESCNLEGNCNHIFSFNIFIRYVIEELHHSLFFYIRFGDKFFVVS